MSNPNRNPATRTPEYAAKLKAWPFQEAYDNAMWDFTDDMEQGDDSLSCVQSIMVTYLQMAWLAARAAFGEAATPDIAWKIYIKSQREAREMTQAFDEMYEKHLADTEDAPETLKASAEETI